MKRIVWLLLSLALSLPNLTACSQPGQAATRTFEVLARWVPGEADSVTFLDLKPGGEAGRHWERIRQRLEANPTGQQGLDGMFDQFKVKGYGLDEFIVGPVVNWYDQETDYVVAQVSDEAAAEAALRQHFEGVVWEQEEYAGRTLYHRSSYPERLAWTIYDGLLFLSSSHNQESLTQLQALVSLDQAHSLAALPAWRTLRDRLPESPMGLAFLNVAGQARRNPPAGNDTSPGTALSQQLVAIALAAVPEEEGMRVEIEGTVALQPDTTPELRAVFNLAGVDPSAWTRLPAETAIALFAHDASLVWPLLKDIFALGSLDQLSTTIGLDLEADLAGAGGPLTGDFTLAITPPLPEQPIIQGLPAIQWLILTRDGTPAQMADVQAAMEGQGAIFGPRELAGVALQTQTGTEPSGYAISYGFEGDTLLFGSSPDVIGQAVAGRREGKGLVTTDAFQSFVKTLPDDPSLVIYFNSEPLTGLAQANMTEEQYQNREEYHLFEVFDAVGLSFHLAPDGMKGVIYFFAR